MTALMPKLAEHSRKLGAIDGMYRRAAIARNGAQVYLMAHSTLVGVRPFAEVKGDSFGILFKPRNTQDEWSTVIINPANTSVSDVHSVSEVPGVAVVLDDMICSGRTEAEVLGRFPRAEFVTAQV